jgi:hypothetical protein
MLASVVLSGCCSIEAKDGLLAVDVAKQEMRRRGWKRIQVDRCVFLDGLWVVDIHRRGFRSGVDFASVKVSARGGVVEIFVNQE